MDLVQGLGPEEYMVRHALPGTYQVKVKLFQSRGRTTSQDVTAQIRIYMFYGDKEREREWSHVVRLSTDKEVIHVANVVF